MKKFIIDVGCAWDAPKGKSLTREYNCPGIFIDADTDSLSMLSVGPEDIKINAAITSYDGEIEFNYYQTYTHSVLKTNLEEIEKYVDGFTGKPADKDKWTAWKTEKIHCFRLKTIIEEYGIEYIPFLKIDTQGHDFEVIKSLEDRMDVVDIIECEVQTTNFEVYINQSKKEELLEWMSARGFELIDSCSQTYNQEENLKFKNIKYA